MTRINFSPRKVQLTISHACATRCLAVLDWQLVVNFMAPTGSLAQILNDSERRTLARLGDGFGADVARDDLLFDWSHIRDSSDAAITNIASGIRQWVTDKVC